MQARSLKERHFFSKPVHIAAKISFWTMDFPFLIWKDAKQALEHGCTPGYVVLAGQRVSECNHFYVNTMCSHLLGAESLPKLEPALRCPCAEPFPFFDLPKPVVLTILCLLDLGELQQLSRTSKSMQKMLSVGRPATAGVCREVVLWNRLIMLVEKTVTPSSHMAAIVSLNLFPGHFIAVLFLASEEVGQRKEAEKDVFFFENKVVREIIFPRVVRMIEGIVRKPHEEVVSVVGRDIFTLRLIFPNLVALACHE